MKFSDQVVIALIALIGPAVFFVAWTVRGAIESARSAHHRLDKMEAGLDKLGDKLQTAIREAWRNCPLAHDTHKGG